MNVLRFSITICKNNKEKLLCSSIIAVLITTPPYSPTCEFNFFPSNTTSKFQPLNQEIINNFKILYRNEIVSEFLACLGNNEIPKVIVFTAIMISYKVWNYVIEQTTHKCFRTCGFVKVINKQEDESPVTV